MADLDVTVVAQYSGFFDNFASWMTGLVRTGELDVDSVDDMVQQVKAKVTKGGKKIALLEIFAHGSDTSFSIGDDDTFHSYTPKKMMPKIQPLAGCFASNGVVSLRICQAGKLREVMTEMAVALGVPVYANSGDVYPNLPGDGDGDNVVARPDRSFSKGVARPSFVDDKGPQALAPVDPGMVYGY